MAGNQLNFNTFTDEKKEKFFRHLSETYNLSKSAKLAGISRQDFYYHRKHNPEFEKRFQECLVQGADALEEVAVERGRAKSDLLLIFTLKGAKPEKYAERRQLSGPGGGPILFSMPIMLGEEIEEAEAQEIPQIEDKSG